MKCTVVIFLALLVIPPAQGSPLFDDDSILDVTLTGPLTTVFSHKRTREEHPFTLAIGDTTTDVAVRMRGNSRVELCRFPPLRLDFSTAASSHALFADQHGLKLVTHCQNGNEQFQDSLLNEFTAYRLFNLISDRSYRVRLLRIRYKDTDHKQKGLEQPHFGFLIESDNGLARRLDGSVDKVKGVRFSTLDALQMARLNVFQYLIGNTDWSLVRADNDDNCCHNLDLLNIDGSVVPIPYDFDLAALTRANYRSDVQLNQSRRREYAGYCKTPAEALDQAVDQIQRMKEQILATAQQVPALDEDTWDRRKAFVAGYFEEALDKPALLAKFRRHCIGRR